MRDTTKSVRRTIAAWVKSFPQEAPSNEYHVRTLRDGAVWVHPRAECDRVRLLKILEANGLRCKCEGEPGTSGEWIIEIAPGVV